MPSDRVICPKCKLNVHYAERVGLEEARRGPAKPSRPRGMDAVRDYIAVLLPVGGVLLPFVVIVALIVIIPVGPDVKADELERSILSELRRESPPSSSGANTSLDCSHPFTNTRTFECSGRLDIALVSDADLRFDVDVSEDAGEVCWTTSPSDDGSPSAALLPEVLSDCLT